MTTDTVEIETIRSDLRHRAWITAGFALLGTAAVLTWFVAGTWVTMGALGVVAGLTLGLSVRHTAQLERRGCRPRSGPAPGAPAHMADGRDILVTAVRHDLPLMVAVCQGLPSGGLPLAGLLAEHTYVAADVIGQLLGRDGNNGVAGLDLGRAAVSAQLGEVAGRAGRLYSAERPGGLDHLDWHLARLWVLTEEYLAVVSPAGDGGPSGPTGTPITWSPVLGHRRRARVLAWLAVASGSDLAVLRQGQAMRTRMWLGVGAARRARSRALRLWGRELASRPAAHSANVLVTAGAPAGRGAA